MRSRFLASGRRTWLLVVVGALFVAACSDGGGSASGPTTTRESTATSQPTTTTTADPTAETEAEVVAAYEAASEAFLEAAAIPDPDFPGLLETHIDPMLDQRRGVLTQLKVQGRVIRLPDDSVHSVEAESFELRNSDTAVLDVCIVDDGERFDATTGALLTDGEPGTSRFEVAMSRVDGRWVLTEQLLQEEWLGVAGCAAD